MIFGKCKLHSGLSGELVDYAIWWKETAGASLPQQEVDTVD